MRMRHNKRKDKKESKNESSSLDPNEVANISNFSSELHDAAFQLARVFYKRGKRLYEDGQITTCKLPKADFQEAIRLAELHKTEETSKLDSLILSDFYFMLGKTYKDGVHDDFEEAIDEFNKAIEYNPQHKDAYENRAIAFLLMGKDAKAIDDLTVLVQLAPNAKFFHLRAVAFAAVGKDLESQQDHAEAAQRMVAEKYTQEDRQLLAEMYDLIADKEELQLRPGDSAPLCLKRIILYLSHAIHLRPEEVDCYNRRAAAYEALGQSGLAAQDRRAAALISIPEQSESKNPKKRKIPASSSYSNQSQSSSSSTSSSSSLSQFFRNVRNSSFPPSTPTSYDWSSTNLQISFPSIFSPAGRPPLGNSSSSQNQSSSSSSSSSLTGLNWGLLSLPPTSPDRDEEDGSFLSLLGKPG